MSELLSTKEYAGVDIKTLNEEFLFLTPSERIERAKDIFGDHVVLATTFGPTAPLLLKAAADSDISIPVVTIRHGHETQETLDHAELYGSLYNLDVHIYRPKAELLPPHDESLTDFQWQAKVEPFQRALDEQGALAYISGAIGWQTDERKDWCFVEQRGDIIAFYPLLDVSRDEVEEFFETTGLPRATDYYDPTKGVEQKSECRLNTVPYVARQALLESVSLVRITA